MQKFFLYKNIDLFAFFAYSYKVKFILHASIESVTLNLYQMMQKRSYNFFRCTRRAT